MRFGRIDTVTGDRDAGSREINGLQPQWTALCDALVAAPEPVAPERQICMLRFEFRSLVLAWNASSPGVQGERGAACVSLSPGIGMSTTRSGGPGGPVHRTDAGGPGQ